MTGGAEIGALELGKRLIRHGDVVTVLTPRLDPRWSRAETIDGVRVHRFDVPRVGRRDGTAILLLASFLRLGRLMRQVAPDVLNMHYALPTGIAGQWWASRLGIPTVLTLIGMDVYDPYYRPAAAFRWLMRRVVMHANAVTCISTFVRDVVAREYPPHRGVVLSVIPYGVDTEQFRATENRDAVRTRYGIGSDDKLVLTVQRLYTRKGVHEFIEAAALVARGCERARFVVVGDGPERRALEDLTAARGLEGRVQFAGAVPNKELPPLYAAADVFAFHTFHEGLGIVLLEAIASGLAVVTTTAGGTVDIVQNGVNGILVPPGNAQALAEAIGRVLADDRLRVALGQRGREIAESTFDWNEVAGQYAETFRRVWRARRRGSST